MRGQGDFSSKLVWAGSWIRSKFDNLRKPQAHQWSSYKEGNDSLYSSYVGRKAQDDIIFPQSYMVNIHETFFDPQN